MDNNYRTGGNVASARLPYGYDKRTARAELLRRMTIDHPNVKLIGGTTLSGSRAGGLLVMVCFDTTTL